MVADNTTEEWKAAIHIQRLMAEHGKFEISLGKYPGICYAPVYSITAVPPRSEPF